MYIYIYMYIYVYMYVYVCICIYIYTSRLAGRYMFNWEYVGIFDMYLPAPTDFINFNFFILLGFFLFSK